MEIVHNVFIYSHKGADKNMLFRILLRDSRRYKVNLDPAYQRNQVLKAD